jgi:hypothetical protein
MQPKQKAREVSLANREYWTLMRLRADPARILSDADFTKRNVSRGPRPVLAKSEPGSAEQRLRGGGLGLRRVMQQVGERSEIRRSTVAGVDVEPRPYFGVSAFAVCASKYAIK